MADIPTFAPVPKFKATIQGLALLAFLAFTVFFTAAFGWHIGVALARVLGL